jgi:hypothetical protein
MLPAGITPGNCWLDLRDGRLMARFGLFFKLDVPLSEVESVEVRSNDWRLVWLKVNPVGAYRDMMTGRRNAVWGRGSYVVITLDPPRPYFFGLYFYRQLLFGLNEAEEFAAFFTSKTPA